MKTFADIARQNRETFRPWRAPDPEFRTVREMRTLRVCEACHSMAPITALIELVPKVKRGVPGRYIHGYCYAVRHGLDAFKSLPDVGGLNNVTLDEFCALGFGGSKYRALADRAKTRRGVILTETHARAASHKRTDEQKARALAALSMDCG